MRQIIGDTVLFQIDEDTAQVINQRVALEGAGNSVIPGQLCAAIVCGCKGNGDILNLHLLPDAPGTMCWIENVEKWNGVAGSGMRKWRPRP